MKRIIVSFLACMLLLTTVACEAKEIKVSGPPTPLENPTYLTTAQDMKSYLGSEDLLLIDARGDLKAYNKGHIPGAILVRWQQFAKTDGPVGEAGWGTLLDKDELTQALQEIGVREDQEIIVYGDPNDGWGEEGRIVWMLSMVGHTNVKILDGGIDLWTDSNYQLSMNNVLPNYGDFVIEEIDTSMSIDTEELANNLENVVLIDARSTEEFEGAQKYSEPRGGHLPGAIQINFTDFVNTDGTIKGQNYIDAVMEYHNITKDDTIVIYGTAGIRSAHMMMILKMAGYENVRNYDESFYRWSNISDYKVVK